MEDNNDSIFISRLPEGILIQMLIPYEKFNSQTNHTKFLKDTSLSPTLVKKLRANGIITVLDCALNLKRIKSIPGIGPNSLDKIKNAINDTNNE